MAYLITFLEGVVTFISPCLLPLLPVYVAYFAGGVTGKKTASASSLKKTLISALCFVLGFTVLFTLMGALTATVGGFFQANQTVLNVICGVIVVFFGLHFAGVLNIPALQKTLRLEMKNAAHGPLQSLLFGLVFAIGWTPCVGAFLGSALSMAATTGSTAQGVALLVCYSLGLGVPFVISALLIDQLEGAFAWVKRNYRTINVVCGVLLVAVGVLMATGQLGRWMALLAA